MNVVSTEIEGVYIIEPQVFGDERGYFFESFNAKHFHAQTGIEATFVQDNESRSRKGVLRGLHFQREPHAQAKLVRVVQGRVLDVAVDIRKDSSTFGKYVAVELSGDNKRQLFIPKGFAHGYVVLEDNTVFQYKCDEYYHPESEDGIAWNDPQLGIEWGIHESEVILSEKDRVRDTIDSIKIK
jgi:dTDP-4-dehydrorhamnose 3,5-epimerase